MKEDRDRVVPGASADAHAAGATSGTRNAANPPGSIGDPRAPVIREARILRAREGLLRRDRMRLVARALDMKISQEVLAAALGVSQATVSRLASRINNDSTLLEESPTEIIEKRAVGLIDDATMMTTLLARPYTPGRYDPTGGNGYVPGTFDEIQQAAAHGLLTDSEYEHIARAAAVARRSHQ